MEFETPKTAEELNELNLQIYDTFYNEYSTESSHGFIVQEAGETLKMWEKIDITRKAVIDAINVDREEGNKAISFYGPWIACEDGSIDYGPNEFYYLSAGWHRDKWILPHVLRKPWRVGTADDLLRAMSDAASIIGIEELNVNLKNL